MTPDHLDTLVSAYLAARGDRLAPTPEQLCGDRPELVPELKRRIAAAGFADALLRADVGPASPDDTNPLHADQSTAHRPPVGTTEPSPSAVDAPPGFAVERVLGEGGMGVVYLARQVGLNRPVALKLVKAGAKVDGKALIRFLAEAEAVAAIRHPNVVEVYQYGEHGGSPYLALEYCPGGDLLALTRGERGRDAGWFRTAAALMAQVAEGVDAAHAQGIVHRDLKPHNVFLAADGTPKVADFGLAKRGVGSDLTNTDAVMGTPAYMAPEQAGGGTKFVGPEADVWALGVMLYELAGGGRPFTAPSALELITRVIAADVPPLKSKCPTVPPDLALIAHKCLSRDPRDRYPTAGGLATDLRNWLDGKPISARPAGVVEQAVKWAGRNKKLAVMGAAVLLTMAAATAVSLGFGLYANEQANQARTEKQEKEHEAKRANAETEKAQRALAKALIASMTTERWEDSSLGVYEQNTLWQLVELRGGPMPILFFEEATNSELAAALFRVRAAFLDHAAVGLDSQRRRQADELLDRCIRDTSLSHEHRLNVALARVRAGRSDPAEATAESLGVFIAETTGGYELCELVNGLAAVAGRLPADRAAELFERAVDPLTAALAKAVGTQQRYMTARGLAAAAEHLPSDQATSILLAAFAVAKDVHEREELAVGLAAVTRRLPADRAAEICRPVADDLKARQVAAKERYERMAMIRGLRAVCERLPAEQGAEMLAATQPEAEDPIEREEVAVGLAKLSPRLAPKQAAAVCRPAAETLAADLSRATDFPERRAGAVGLAAVAGCLPEDEAVGLCGPAVEQLTAVRATEKDETERWGLAWGLAAVAGCLPADRGVEILTAALATATEESERVELVSGLARVCERLPRDAGVEVLAAAFVSAWGGDERREMVTGPATNGRLPADRAAALTQFLEQTTDRAERRKMKGVVATIASGLSERDRIHLQHRDEFAALAGVTVLHPGILPKPRPLPPEQLVELLKHPFCVQEMRRAVLDALEFTYGRTFADLWAFVAFAEQEHPELDLLTPPQRPK